jgi:hypothetical protein
VGPTQLTEVSLIAFFLGLRNHRTQFGVNSASGVKFVPVPYELKYSDVEKFGREWQLGFYVRDFFLM